MCVLTSVAAAAKFELPLLSSSHEIDTSGKAITRNFSQLNCISVL